MKVSIGGVILGGIVDVVLTNVLAIPLFAYAIAKHALLNVPKGQMESTLAMCMLSDPVLLVGQWVVGLIGTVVGGFVAAWIAKRYEVLNGALSAWLCIAFGIYTIVIATSRLSVLR